MRKPLTSSAPTSTSSTTEAPLAEDKEDQDSNNFEQYKRRFKPKSTFSRRPVKKEDDPLPASVNADEEEVAGKKKSFSQTAGSPFGRRRQQQQEKQKRLLDEDKPEEPSVPASLVRINKETPKRIRPGYGRSTTTESSLDNEEEEFGSVLAPPWSATSVVRAASQTGRWKEIGNRRRRCRRTAQDVGQHHFRRPQSGRFDRTGKRLPCPARAVPTGTGGRALGCEHGRGRSATEASPFLLHHGNQWSHPILPIEELFNIRVRDNGTGMWITSARLP